MINIQTIQYMLVKSHSPTILLIEDDIILGALLHHVLSPKYEVHLCTDGSNAIHEIVENNIDIIITDLLMPTMGGIAVIAHAKRLRSKAKILAISGLSNNSSVSYLTMAKLMGADEILQKPFEMSVFTALVDKMIENE